MNRSAAPGEHPLAGASEEERGRPSAPGAGRPVEKNYTRPRKVVIFASQKHKRPLENGRLVGRQPRVRPCRAARVRQFYRTFPPPQDPRDFASYLPRASRGKWTASARDNRHRGPSSETADRAAKSAPESVRLTGHAAPDEQKYQCV